LQLSAGLMLFFYVINYPKYRKHRFYKYHWDVPTILLLPIIRSPKI
jgi:hypothetical protein